MAILRSLALRPWWIERHSPTGQNTSHRQTLPNHVNGAEIRILCLLSSVTTRYAGRTRLTTPPRNARFLHMETTREKVLRLTKAGVKPREIGYLCNISVQAVHKHLRKLRRDGELSTPEEGAA